MDSEERARRREERRKKREAERLATAASMQAEEDEAAARRARREARRRELDDEVNTTQESETYTSTTSFSTVQHEPEHEPEIHTTTSTYKSSYSREPEPEPEMEEPEPEPEEQEPEPEIEEPYFADEPEQEPEPEPEPARLSRRIEEPPVDEKPKLRKIPTIDKTDDDSGSRGGSEAIHQLEEIREKREREEQERMEQQMEHRRLERERQKRELEELRERKEQRKREQEEREKKRRQDEAERKAKEEEEAAKRREEMERRKAEAREKRLNMMNGGKQNVVMRQLGIRANISKARQESSKESAEKALEKERVLKERIPALKNTDLASVQRLQELAQEYNDHLNQVLNNVYDLKQRDKRQKYDINELSQRLKELSKASVKKIGIGVETQKVSKFMDRMGTQQEQEGSKGEQRRFSRFKERNEGIAASGGVAGRLSMFQQQTSPSDSSSTPRRGGSRVWKPPVGDKCSICNKTVYAMEKLEADKKVFHKLCFRCDTCKRAITLTNFAVLDDKYYCKPHQRKIIRERGQGEQNGPPEENHTENHTNGDADEEP